VRLVSGAATIITLGQLVLISQHFLRTVSGSMGGGRRMVSNMVLLLGMLDVQLRSMCIVTTFRLLRFFSCRAGIVYSF